MLLMAIAWISGMLTSEGIFYIIKGDWVSAAATLIMAIALGIFVLKKLRVNEKGHWEYDDE